MPARAAFIGVVDRLFSRVGASDDLARGRSDAVVEMVREPPRSLNRPARTLLVISGEIGRGAAFDGIDHLRARVRSPAPKNRARAIFAAFPRDDGAGRRGCRRLWRAMRQEWENDVVFLHEVAKGAADRSYSVQVARLASLPAAVVARAKDVLAQLESGETSGKADDWSTTCRCFQPPAPRATTGSEGRPSAEAWRRSIRQTDAEGSAGGAVQAEGAGENVAMSSRLAKQNASLPF